MLHHSRPYSKLLTGIVRNWTKLKTQSFLLNGPDVSSVYFDFHSGSFDHPLSKNNFTIRQNIINSSLTYSRLKLINNLGCYFSLTIKNFLLSFFIQSHWGSQNKLTKHLALLIKYYVFLILPSSLLFLFFLHFWTDLSEDRSFFFRLQGVNYIFRSLAFWTLKKLRRTSETSVQNCKNKSNKSSNSLELRVMN